MGKPQKPREKPRRAQWLRKEARLRNKLKDAIQACYETKRVSWARMLEDFLVVVKQAQKGE